MRIELKHLETNPQIKGRTLGGVPSFLSKRVEDDSVWDLLTDFSDVIRKNPKLKLADKFRQELHHSALVYRDELGSSSELSAVQQEEVDDRLSKFRLWMETFVKEIKDTEAVYRQSTGLLESMFERWEELGE